MDMSTLLYILIGLVGLLLILMIFLLSRSGRGEGEAVLRRVEQIRREMEESQRTLRQELSESSISTIRSLGGMLGEQLGKNEEGAERRFRTFAVENEAKLDLIRVTVERRLTYLQQENNQKLDEMRKIVDEKLQKTLEERMTRSFQLVSERLEQVYRGLGEMQTLAAGVGDLKKILSNVKTRGILGEIQLGAILEEILAPEQYLTNVATKVGSRNVVEFAVKLPNEDGSHTLLPIDAKFPGDAYGNLRDAYEAGDVEQVRAMAAILTARIRSEAKDIRDKYVDPPNTTEFAILFLPFEGLYAEAVNRGLVEILQRDYRVNLAGPSTMAALLNSLQMGFKTFAIQRRTAEVWDVLGAVKTEFDRFAEVLTATQNRLEQAGNELDKLVGVRTRQIQRRLRGVTALTPIEAKGVLEGDVGPAGLLEGEDTLLEEEEL